MHALLHMLSANFLAAWIAGLCLLAVAIVVLHLELRAGK